MDKSRQEIEKAFHERYLKESLSDRELIFSDKAFFIGPSWNKPFEIIGDLKDKMVVDYGCGVGISSVVLARHGAIVHAFDISSKSIDLTVRRAKANGVDDKVFARQMAAEKLDYPDEMFDAVYGDAILHHVDLKEASGELYRVMKPGGVAVFSEPLGENQLLEFARKYLPYYAKKRTPTEKPLTYRDIKIFSRPFSEITLFEVQLFEMIRRVIKNKTLINKLADLDRFVLVRFPFLKKYCRGVIIKLVK